MAPEAETTTEETPEVTEEAPNTDPPESDEPKNESEFSASYVEKLRRENAKHRSELRDAQEKLKTIEDAEKSELEKLQERVAAAEEEKTAALERANKNLIRAAVIAEAAHQGAVDPDVVVALVDSEAIEVGEDGEVSGQAAAVAQLLEAKTYLKKNGSPAGPGGGGMGRESKEPSLSAEQVRDLAKNDPAKFNEMFEAGQVPASALGAGGSRMP
jgi:hypothetical protein